MHTIIVFASFFSYRNFIYTWNHSFISFLPFFSCFSSNNSSNPHHILIKTFFRQVFLLHDSFESFFLVSIQTERKYRIEKKLFLNTIPFIYLFFIWRLLCSAKLKLFAHQIGLMIKKYGRKKCKTQIILVMKVSRQYW